MKTILTTLSLVFCSFFLFAQENNGSLVLNEQTSFDAVSKSKSAENTKLSKALKKIYSFKHSKSAATQLRLFVAQHAVYPEIMRENNIEGKVVLAVKISSNGKIESASVFRGINSELDKASLDAVKLMKNIVLNESIYYGNKTIYVPVDFTITDI